VHVQKGTFVIFDDLVASKPATFQWLLHAHDKIDIDGKVLSVRRNPATMKVHMLLPKHMKISQTDKYDPEPEKLKLRRLKLKKTWHLTASTKTAAVKGQFLTVLQVHDANVAGDLAKVKLLEGKGAVGVLLTKADGTVDTIGFRVDVEADEVSCGGITSASRVFAEGRDGDGKTVRTLNIPVD
jgi:hypothetical protein